MKNQFFKILLFGCFCFLTITSSVGNVTPSLYIPDEGDETANAESTVGTANSLLLGDLSSVDCKELKAYSSDYGVDYRLILAMIKQESQFDENAVSEKGARGLMQIMPVTNSELSAELDLQETQLPHQNIITGIYYFSKLYDLFNGAEREDRLRLALAAYNAGPSRVYDAQELAAYLGENPSRWSAIQHTLPLLSKRYYSLHESVWGDIKPPAGYFGSCRQTTGYVDAVMKNYAQYSAGS